MPHSLNIAMVMCECMHFLFSSVSSVSR